MERDYIYISLLFCNIIVVCIFRDLYLLPNTNGGEWDFVKALENVITK